MPIVDKSRRFTENIDWVGCQNGSGQTIPPFSLVQVQAWSLPDISGDTVDSSSPFIIVQQPGSGGQTIIDPTTCYLSGASAIAPGSIGRCARPTANVPLLVSLSGGQNDFGDAPYRLVGPSSGSWSATRDYPGFAMVAQPQAGYALIVPVPPAQMQLYVTIAGPGSTPYPKLSETPTVYYAQLLQGATFPNQVGAQTIQPIQNQTASFSYVWCNQTYLFQGTGVAVLDGIVVGLVTGSRFEIGMAGTLVSQLSSGGTSTASVTYTDSLGNTVNDTLTVWENIGLPSTQSIPAGTGVFIEWDNSLNGWVVVSTACGTNKGGQDKPISRTGSGTPTSTGSGGGFTGR